MKAELGRQISMVAALEEPARRALYFHVASRSPELVSRDEAAAAVEINRRLAAFHLDKLVEVGLLEAIHRRLTGRTGPGAGRPAKLYRRADVQVEISLPERRHLLLARLLAEAIKVDDPGPATALKERARGFGVELGKQARARAVLRRTRPRLLDAAAAILEELGFEPSRPAAGAIRLRNCPFRPLASDHPETICGVMNLGLFEGFLAGLGAGGTRAYFQPDRQACCVSLQPS